MLLFQAKGAADFAVLFLAVPERAVGYLEVVARPGPPTGELARRCLHGAVMAGNGIFRHDAHRILPAAKMRLCGDRCRSKRSSSHTSDQASLLIRRHLPIAAERC